MEFFVPLVTFVRLDVTEGIRDKGQGNPARPKAYRP
jgi:hypothetical protein